MYLQDVIVTLLDVILDRRTAIVPVKVPVSLAPVNQLLVLKELKVLAHDPTLVGGVGLSKLLPGLIERETLDTDLVVFAVT